MEEQILTEEQIPAEERPNPPRRRRKTKMEVIKESYLPYIFLMTAALLCLIFIIGALIRG